ncbi:EAL domain-containing protein [Oxynema sp. CENA135]|uniref:EAL domain-containing protein n=1 Tax=Oxynema sp. CENA135 TaxID=984206 RepID=UPI00190D0197|nr:EAL domain-containing protein [Oxynema sp. CENA135]MBK4730001.1 EAL domain-containing protein [Oxynema sp. CENA135]
MTIQKPTQSGVSADNTPEASLSARRTLRERERHSQTLAVRARESEPQSHRGYFERAVGNLLQMALDLTRMSVAQFYGSAPRGWDCRVGDRAIALPLNRSFYTRCLPEGRVKRTPTLGELATISIPAIAPDGRWVGNIWLFDPIAHDPDPTQTAILQGIARQIGIESQWLQSWRREADLRLGSAFAKRLQRSEENRDLLHLETRSGMGCDRTATPEADRAIVPPETGGMPRNASGSLWGDPSHTLPTWSARFPTPFENPAEAGASPQERPGCGGGLPASDRPEYRTLQTQLRDQIERRQQLERDLEQSQDRLRKVLETISNAVCCKQEKERFEGATRAIGLDLLRLGAARIGGQNGGQIARYLQIDPRWPFFWQFLGNGDGEATDRRRLEVNSTYCLVCPDGENLQDVAFWTIPLLSAPGKTNATARFESAWKRRSPGEFYPSATRKPEMGSEKGVEVAMKEGSREHTPTNDLLDGSETVHRETLAKMRDPVFMTDDRGEFTFVCPNVEGLFGYSIAEMQALGNVEELLGENLFDRAELDRRGEIYNIERQVYDKAGRCHRLPIAVKRVAIERGRLLYSCHDITDAPEIATHAGEALTEANTPDPSDRDPLTGLPNRSFFLNTLRRVADYHGSDSRRLAVLFLDLDRFKLINESLGHAIGDRLLIEVADRLCRTLSSCKLSKSHSTYVVARLGGDEFAILLDPIEGIEEALALAECLQAAIAVPCQIEGHELFSTTSIGIATSGNECDRVEDLLRDADTAMYRAKGLGGARHQVFDPAMRDRVTTRLQLETDLRWAIVRQEFFIQYQPIVALESGRICGFEALVRWQHPRRGLVSPDRFIPIAEETGSILPLGRWILDTSIAQLHAWQQQFSQDPPLTLNVNLSGKQLFETDLILELDRILARYPIVPGTLKLEITETVLMENAASVETLLEQFRARQIQVCIDDFGTGYSSLSYLRRFPIDTLKIDRSFVASMGIDRENSEIVRAIVMLSHNLNIDVTAEGVESEEQLVQLWALQCEYAQGYFFSKPLDADRATEFIASGPQW